MSILMAISIHRQAQLLTNTDSHYPNTRYSLRAGRSLLLCCALLLVAQPAQSETGLLFGAGGGYGAHTAQVGGLWTQPWTSMHSQLFYGLAGEVAAWRYGDDDMVQLSLVPLLQYNFMPNANWRPFVFAGVGPAWISRTQLGDRDLSSEFQFSSRVGVGLRKSRHSVAVEARHLSNGGIKEPNQGISYWNLTYGYHF
ncbi:acyloxyacyl hydrolase [Oceanisphaera sp. W20_SRM_FM3]|uniref:acyloxyacyl hydrolase n=1 Tax=Oceanisphaera sp. W20_SRM_FM3 TaxID=3240267 RepID=UPI003F96E2E6